MTTNSISRGIPIMLERPWLACQRLPVMQQAARLTCVGGLPAQVLCRSSNQGPLLCGAGQAASTEGGAKNKFALLMGCRSVTSFHDLGLPRLWRASIAADPAHEAQRKRGRHPNIVLEDKDWNVRLSVRGGPERLQPRAPH